MKAYLNRRYRFAASHRLHNDAWSEERNTAIYGKCNNPYGHGHNYVVEITLSGQVDPKTGMVCNLADLDSFVNERIVQPFEFTNLNERPEFKHTIPTTENLCREIYGVIARNFHLAKLENVRIEETMMNSFEFAGDSEMHA